MHSKNGDDDLPSRSVDLKALFSALLYFRYSLLCDDLWPGYCGTISTADIIEHHQKVQCRNLCLITDNERQCVSL